MLVGQLLLGSGVWQACQSLPTRTLHQGLVPLHVGILPFFPFSRRDGCSSPHTHVLAIFPHVETIILLLMHRSWNFTHAKSWESGLMGTILLCVWISWLGDFAMYISLRCGSNHVNSPPRGLFFLPHTTKKSITIGFPMILVFYGFIYVFGFSWVLIESFWPWYG